ncbi:unnamed protein product [marine sediment metagenome]|uniref:Uncharacterized protein n=1 Tax=marine sediment metagenome TaxID=412755 RepID=X1H2F2_9ZZZZ
MKIMDVKLSDPVYSPLRQMTDAINILPTAMTYNISSNFHRRRYDWNWAGSRRGTKQSTH